MRLVLPAGIHARPLVLDEVGGWRETAIFVYGQHTHASAMIVGREDEAACRVHLHVTRAWAARAPAVDVGQLTRIGIYRVGVHRSLFLAVEFVDFRCRVQESLAGVKRKEGRVSGSRRY